jgi:MFS family permease
MTSDLFKDMPPEHMALRVSGLCFVVLFLEGYDVSAMGYTTPSLIEAWHTSAPQFTSTVTLGALSMLIGSLSADSPGDRLGCKPVLIACVAVFGNSLPYWDGRQSSSSADPYHCCWSRF